ncbi:MAG: lipid A export permease/ATP-binding protein MsbA [Oxalicibacterium faecigallinarum]|uniref:lipid A export permease/ATP-binding protein MsbA n=1 Tax=Oxalicibacterium faecigallinarum TaxID=573741 RepID=UPI002806ACD7|nr:lipid A export permease/ATP-binding protein MsbA [Oxalicibacterium faecigallinarum]MDQ7969186.1 lipid A export permease/ATP-binding protein MsbA [Oxalicibacterium faecigallinarum]
MKFPEHLRRLFGMLSPYKGRLVIAFCGMIMTALTEPMFPAVMRVLLDKGFGGKPSFSLWLVPVAIVGIFVLRGMSTYTTTYMMTWVSSRLLNTLRRQMFARILDVPLGFYAHHSVGKVINSMMFEVQQIVDMVTKVFTSMIRDSLTVIVLLSFLFWLNWRLTLVALVLLPLIAVVVRATGKRVRRLTREYQTVNAEMTQVMEETTRANQVIKIFGGHQYEIDRFEARADKLRSYTMRMASTLAATTPVTQVMAASAVAVVIVIALIQSGNNETTVGGFVSFITAMLMLLTPLKNIAEVNGPLQRGLTAAEAVFAVIDAKTERTTGKVLSKRADGRLDFVDLSFAYPGQSTKVLHDINLTVLPGETIAFVGMSGGGKSTLVNLVPGFYPVETGEIRLDGDSIDDIALTSLRQQIAMVSQHVVLFDDTVAANVAYGDAQPDPSRIQAALKAAHLEEVVAGLPQGMQTVIGDNGSRLSGGQRQRLAIARAIYKDAPILILDEATSALDSESERAVQAALDKLMEGRTTLVIAHRLSTIERADRIAVVDDGRIVELGSHAELLKKNEVYANLYQLQFAKDDSEIQAE